jgi:DNA-binding response OmpR family regulator
MESRYRLLIVDDEPAYADALAGILRRVGYQVTVVHDEEAALHELQENRGYNLVLLDLYLDGSHAGPTGLNTLEQIQSPPHPLPVMILTSKGPAMELISLKIGAIYYIEKTVKPDLLLARIKAVLRMSEDSQPYLLHIDNELAIDTGGQTAYFAGEDVALTPREYDLLYFLAINAGRGVSRQELLDAVWGVDYPGDERVVDRFIATIRNKIKDNPPHYILTEYGKGYRFCKWERL